jgi:hypothetical protein
MRLAAVCASQCRVLDAHGGFRSERVATSVRRGKIPPRLTEVI